MRNKKYSNHIFRIKHRRGLANVVTSAIILSAVSIMGVMLLGWSQSNINEQKIEMNEVYDTQINKIREDLLFENIWFATPGGGMTENHLNVTLTNIGILGLNVTSIQVTNTTGSNTTSIPYPVTSPDGEILISSSISLNTTYPWDSGDELDIIVFTDRGNQFITQEVAP